MRSSSEAIAQANPDWLIVLDRDAAVQADGHVAAQQLIIEAEALQNVTAVQQGQVIVLDPTFYLDEGIQAYTTLYQTVADAFADAGCTDRSRWGCAPSAPPPPRRSPPLRRHTCRGDPAECRHRCRDTCPSPAAVGPPRRPGAGRRTDRAVHADRRV